MCAWLISLEIELKLQADAAADKNVGSGDKYSSVLKLMQFIGTVYGGASVTQVALNYLRAKGMHLHSLKYDRMVLVTELNAERMWYLWYFVRD